MVSGRHTTSLSLCKARLEFLSHHSLTPRRPKWAPTRPSWAR